MTASRVSFDNVSGPSI